MSPPALVTLLSKIGSDDDDDSDVICIDSPHLKKNLSNNSNFGGVDDSDDCVILEDDLLDAENINEQSDKNTTANMECESFAEFKGAGDELHTTIVV